MTFRGLHFVLLTYFLFLQEMPDICFYSETTDWQSTPLCLTIIPFQLILEHMYCTVLQVVMWLNAKLFVTAQSIYEKLM